MKPCRENPEQWFLTLPAGPPTDRTQHKIIEDTRKARDLCFDCNFMIQCGEFGMLPENLRHGMWGGMLSAERMAKAGVKPGYKEERLLELVNNGNV